MPTLASSPLTEIAWTVHTEQVPAGTVTVHVGMSPLGDRYLIQEPEQSWGNWPCTVERNYADLIATATSRLPGIILPCSYSLDTAKDTARIDAEARAYAAALADGTTSADAPRTIARIEHRLQRLARNDDGTQTWEDMYPLTSTDDPQRVKNTYATNPYRRVVHVAITETTTPL